MPEEYSYLKIDNKEDRVTIASILFANGYKVKPHRIKRGRAYEYYVGYAEVREDEINEG